MVNHGSISSKSSLLCRIVVAPAILCLILTSDVQGQGIVPWPTEQSITPLNKLVKDEATVQLRMQGAKPTKDNGTVCTGFKLKDTSNFWIIQIAGVANWATMHHLGLYACDHVPTGSACSCGMANRSPIYAWSRYTNAVRFTGINNYVGGFHVGGTTDSQFIFIEAHYHGALGTADTTSGFDIHITRTTTIIYDLMIYSIMSTGTIQSNTAKQYLDACVTVPSIPLNNVAVLQYFGHQAHTHNMGRLVSAYHRSAKYGNYKIGRGNPAWPQVYRQSLRNTPNAYRNLLAPGDYLFSRCYYTSTGVSFNVNTIGKGLAKTNWTEMCLSNIIISADNPNKQISTKNALLTGKCTSAQSAFITSTWPDSTQLLPSNSVLDSVSVNGGNTGVVSVSSSYSVNLGTETFTDFF